METAEWPLLAAEQDSLSGESLKKRRLLASHVGWFQGVVTLWSSMLAEMPSRMVTWQDQEGFKA